MKDRSGKFRTRMLKYAVIVVAHRNDLIGDCDYNSARDISIINLNEFIMLRQDEVFS